MDKKQKSTAEPGKSKGDEKIKISFYCPEELGLAFKEAAADIGNLSKVCEKMVEAWMTEKGLWPKG